MINRYLPDFLGGLSGPQVTGLLDDLTDEALRPGSPTETVRLTAPEMVPVPEAYRRADGLSLWRRHGAEVYTTRAMLDTEARLWREHGHPGADTAQPGADVAPRGAEPPLSSSGLADDQAQAAYGILTSGRAIDILIGPAGTGKTRTVARIAAAWQEAGIGRVIGLTASTNAAHALAAEGLAESYNLARFLGRIKDSNRTRGHLPVQRGDLLVVDEASMVSTADLAAVEDIATRRGAKILLTGDTEQLSVPDAGGAMRLLADEHGYYQLATVQRFEQDWERDASLRLRNGDADVLAEYDQHGRILEGTREQMSDAAIGRWLADHLSGKAALLLAVTNAQAAELARRARDELALLGLIGTEELIELADRNVAGVGDLIVARQNSPIVAGETGRLLANRDVLRICAWDEMGEERVARVRRVTGRDSRTGEVVWSALFELPEEYLERHVELAYAGNVYAAQGRTVDTAHVVADETADRESLYVGMSRGRERNTVYVVTERVHVAELAAESRPAPEIKDPAADEDAPRRASRFAVLADALRRRQADRTATAAMRDELEHEASLATLAPMWADVTRAHATRHYEGTLRSLLAGEEWRRFEEDPERGTLTRLLRAADLAGHDVDGVLRRAVQTRDFGGARSIAAVLYGRVHRIAGTPEPQAGASHTQRTPAIDDPVADQFARDLAAAMDARVSLLGRRVAADRPVWALRYLGDLPADPAERADWRRRAGAVAAYREERGTRRRPKPPGPLPNAALQNCGPVGTPPTSRCSCRMMAERSRPRPTASSGPGGPRTRGRPAGLRHTSLASCVRPTLPRTPTGPTPCWPGIERMLPWIRPSGSGLGARLRSWVRWRRRLVHTARR